MHGWKYIGKSKVVILANKDDFTNVPPEVAVAVAGVVPQPWGDRPGNPMPLNLVGARLDEIEEALRTRGWFSS